MFLLVCVVCSEVSTYYLNIRASVRKFIFNIIMNIARIIIVENNCEKGRWIDLLFSELVYDRKRSRLVFLRFGHEM